MGVSGKCPSGASTEGLQALGFVPLHLNDSFTTQEHTGIHTLCQKLRLCSWGTQVREKRAACVASGDRATGRCPSPKVAEASVCYHKPSSHHPDELAPCLALQLDPHEAWTQPSCQGYRSHLGHQVADSWTFSCESIERNYFNSSCFINKPHSSHDFPFIQVVCIQDPQRGLRVFNSACIAF